MPDFTPQERQILKPYFTNLDDDIFVLINLPEVVKGALFSRYSRSSKSLRRTLLDEFILNRQSEFRQIVGKSKFQTQDSFVATQKAKDFYHRVLVGFGDDSVAELAGVHLAVENVTQMIGAKALEGNRIGISPLEKSTRYVRYDDQINGRYRYLLEPKIIKSRWGQLYQQTNDHLFVTYSHLVEALQDWVRQHHPQPPAVKDGVYRATVRAKACDLCRQLLPLSTLTNVGLFGNGRSFEYLLIKMFASPYTEVQDIAQKIKRELDKVIPSFIKRSTNQRGQAWQEYLQSRRQATASIGKSLSESSADIHRSKVKKPRRVSLSKLPDSKARSFSSVSLLDYDPHGQDKVVAAMLYSLTHQPLAALLDQVSRFSSSQKQAAIKAYCSGRQNRHHKLGRALEMTDYVFEILAPIGVYKDLQRHRMLTPLVQSYAPFYGYAVPQEIITAGFAQPYCQAMDQAAAAFTQIACDFPLEAQYVVPLGFRMRWVFKMNLREVCHLTELRSSPQGHPHYRVVAQKISRQVRRVHPLLAKYATQFVNYDAVSLERLESEKKIEKKRAKLKKEKSN